MAALTGAVPLLVPVPVISSSEALPRSCHLSNGRDAFFAGSSRLLSLKGSRHVPSENFTSRRSGVDAARQKARQSHLTRAHKEEAADEVDVKSCPAVKPEIPASVFHSVDLRVGVVRSAKPVIDRELSRKRGQPMFSRKFLQLEVDIGCEKRNVVSECKFVMDVEDAVGKKVLFVANVPPETVEGTQSHGFILSGLNYDPTPMPRSFKVILPGFGRLPPGSPILPPSVAAASSSSSANGSN
eukprot:TRINITY_DN1305_c0_g1_i2.p1 TRINITY_DN1305_c0_g1~~TRINITY_DN1305_c0_g1_i2.p1  ORF type:complete len:248 (-),score=44.10 TRINITY_DN1305_c0_g1_i2:137-859(-)